MKTSGLLDVHVGPARPLERRQMNPAVAALVLHVVERVDEVRDARQAGHEAEAQRPQTVLISFSPPLL
jgi:hypothetical protein